MPAASLRTYVLTALFAAAAAAGGYLLMAIPNIELFTLILFAAGYTLGPLKGASAAAAAAFLYFGLNPQGGFFPPLLISQIVGAMAAPVAGWICRLLPLSRGLRRIACGLSGLLVTLWYDLLTNLSYPLTAGFDLTQTAATLIAGIPFAVVHILGNTIIFLLLAPPLIVILEKKHLVVTG